MEFRHLRKKLITGLIGLTFRKAILDAISFVSIYIVLAKLLPISTIGIFGIASALLAFFTYFSDVGLAGAIIQRKDISKDDLKTTFLIQQLLASAILVIVWFSAPILGSFYNFDIDSVWLIRALGVGFFLTSLKVIPVVLLERELRFQPIIWVDIVEALSFNILLVWLTFQGMGIWAFTWATIVRSLAGVIVIYVLAPWKVEIGFSKQSAKQLFHFGIPFQLNSILALLKDRLTPLITAQIIGKDNFGYVTWSQGIAYRPLELMGIVIRVTFPAFARLQENYAHLKNIVEKSLFLTVTLVYPLVFGMLAILPNFISVMGKDKFEPALPLFYLFAFSTLLSAVSTVFTNVLNAIGKVSTTLKLMIMWTALTWAISPLFAYVYGYIGVAIAAAVISLTSFIPIIIVVNLIRIDLVKTIWKPILASIIMYVMVYGVSTFFYHDVRSLVIMIGLGAAVYIISLWFLAKSELQSLIKEFRDENS